MLKIAILVVEREAQQSEIWLGISKKNENHYNTDPVDAPQIFVHMPKPASAALWFYGEKYSPDFTTPLLLYIGGDAQRLETRIHGNARSSYPS